MNQTPTEKNNQDGIDKSSLYKNLGGFNKSNHDADLPF